MIAVGSTGRLDVKSVVAHVDLDAFYTQVEVQRNPDLRGKPLAVVQYNPFGDLRSIPASEPRLFNTGNGSLIAVSYEARAFGVKRSMRGDEARRACPSLQLVQVPTARGKADLAIYREGGEKVIDILARGGICERASIDEAYVDVTEEAARRLMQCDGQPPPLINPDECFVYGATGKMPYGDWLAGTSSLPEGDALLAAGAAVVAELRHAVRVELGYSCSAGIAHNKLLAKLCSGLHKPSKQTVLPEAAVPALLAPLPLAKLRSLGGKLGQSVTEVLSIETVGQLAEVPISRLESLFGSDTGPWLYRMARGVHADPVTQRTLPKSLGCGKTFRSHHTIRSLAEAERPLQQIADELAERVADDVTRHRRTPQTLSLGITTHEQHLSRSCPLTTLTASAIGHAAFGALKRWVADAKEVVITGLSLCASNFAAASTAPSIASFFPHRAEALRPSAALGASDQIGTMAGADHRDAGAIPDTGNVERPVAAGRRSPPSGRLTRADIDADVLSQLPPDIQAEVLGALSPPPLSMSDDRRDGKKRRKSGPGPQLPQPSGIARFVVPRRQAPQPDPAPTTDPSPPIPPPPP